MKDPLSFLLSKEPYISYIESLWDKDPVKKGKKESVRYMKKKRSGSDSIRTVVEIEWADSSTGWREEKSLSRVSQGAPYARKLKSPTSHRPQSQGKHLRWKLDFPRNAFSQRIVRPGFHVCNVITFTENPCRPFHEEVRGGVEMCGPRFPTEFYPHEIDVELFYHPRQIN